MSRLKYQAPAVSFAILICALSSIPGNRLAPSPFFSFDKVLHLLEFGLFGYLLAMAFEQGTSDRLRQHWVLLALCTGILYGLSDEWHQRFVPGRSGTVADFLADAVGVMAALLLYRWRMARRAA